MVLNSQFTKVTKDNISYTPRDNILKIIKDNLSDKTISIHSVIPDLTNRNQNAFPFIVIPEFSLTPNENVTLKGNIQYTETIDCTIYHKQEKLGDNKARTIKQDLLKIQERDNKKKVQKYCNVYIDTITFDQSDLIPELRDRVRIVPFDFSITIKMDIDMGV